MLLLWFACASKEAPTADEFRNAWAAAACEQLFRCKPDSWATLDGIDSCKADQYNLLFGQSSGQCLSFNQDDARACLTAIEELPCAESLIEGNTPSACANIWIWEPNCASTGWASPG